MTVQEFNSKVKTDRGITGWMAECRTVEWGRGVISASSEDEAISVLLSGLISEGLIASESMEINHGG